MNNYIVHTNSYEWLTHIYSIVACTGDTSKASYIVDDVVRTATGMKVSLICTHSNLCPATIPVIDNFKDNKYKWYVK